VTRIDVLPDDVLLTIFNLYIVGYLHTKPVIEEWQSLVHVCRRWRSIVFGSPRHLNLRLFCTPETPVMDTLDVWPPLPLLINGDISSAPSVDNIVVALGHNNRVREVDLGGIAGPQTEKVLVAMQMPFPEVTRLCLAASTDDQTLPAVPDSFLGGSAPCLRYFSLDGIPFPGLSKFLLSATHLVDLHLHIPQSGYISPEAMVTCLSMLTSLDKFTLIFQSFRSHPDSETQHSHLATCSALPALRSFQFEGSSGYLEYLVARIDAPRLYHFSITFYYQVDFNIPRLLKFISRTLTFKGPVEAHAVFELDVARVKLVSQTFCHGEFHVQIRCRSPASQLRSLVQAFASSPYHLSTVEDLYIDDQGSVLIWTSRVEIDLWWEFLRPFVAVKNIYLSSIIAFHVGYSLQELGGGRNLEMLPALQNFFLDLEVGPHPSRVRYDQEPILGQFVAARQLFGHPITITVSR